VSFLQQLWQPIATLFHYVFYLPIFNVLMLLYAGVHAVAPGLPAFAIAIFFLTVLVRLCLFPLTRKQLQSSRAMQALQPQMQELQRRYKNNPQELMAAQRALYQEHGVSMYGGCLPLLIQMPFLYGLYFSLYTALIAPKGSHGQTLPPAQAHPALLHNINQDIYPFLPHLTLHTLPSTTFLWTDLAGKDPFYILPILAALLTFIQLRMAQPVKRPTPPGQRADPNTQAMSSMQYFMPFITLFMAANFPSGLAFYWTISTGFSAVQQYLLTGFGSLFVGIPGMEHLVPEPQPLPGLPAPRTAAASGLVDAGSTSAARPSRLNALASMLRQLAEPPKPQEGSNGTDQATPSPGSQKPAARAPGKAEAERAPRPAAPSVSAGDLEPGATNGAAPPAARRPRPARTGPTLVRSPSSGAPAAPLPAPAETRVAESQSAEAATSATPSESAALAAPRPSSQVAAAASNGTANGAKAAAPADGTAIGTTKAGAPANGTTNGAKPGVPTNGTRPGAPAKTPLPPRPATTGSAAKASSAKQSQRPASTGSRGSGGGAAGRRRPSGKSKGGR
jgi:YidC/Oxa1 family membrane protein insertase